MISLEEIDQVIQSGPFEPTWDSLSHQVCPDWYRDAKFGMFIHWGVYSVPAFGSEWYSRNMYPAQSAAGCTHNHPLQSFLPLLPVRLSWHRQIH